MRHLLLLSLLVLLAACGGGGGGSSSTGKPNEPVLSPFKKNMTDRLNVSSRVDGYTLRYGVPVRWEWTVPVQRRFALGLVDDAIDELNLCLPSPLDTSMVYLVLGAPEELFRGEYEDWYWDYPEGMAILQSNDVIVSAFQYRDEIYYIIETIKHEFIHIYLHQTGFPISKNAAHKSNFFPECSDLPYRTEDGE